MDTRGLAIEEVSFGVRARQIVRDVWLRVAPGETVAVIGPSGCGKTTLLRLVAGLERPDRGRIVFDGEDVTGVPAHKRGFGMMFQDFALFPHLSVEKNAEFGLRRRRLSTKERKQRVRELLEVVGLGGYEGRSPETLSGGERQRLALARALAPEPRLLMLDEPLGSLDRALKERLLVELRGVLRRLRIPAIYVTHDQYEAFAMADRIALMREGEWVRVATPRELYDEPGTAFAARFLGLQNVVEGVREADGAVRGATGTWRTAPGAPGRVLLLLRGEGVAVTEAGGVGVVTGTVTSKLFQGQTMRLRLQAGEDELEFVLDASAPAPAEGFGIALRVPRVQVLENDN